MVLRSVSLAAGLSLAAAFVLALPLSTQAGAHCNCGGAHGSAGAHVSVHTSVRASVSAHASAMGSGWGRSGGGYVVRTGYNTQAYGGGYAHPVHYANHMTRYNRSYPTHYPARYPNQGGYAYNNGHNYQRDYDHRGYEGRAYGGNDYSLVYAPTYADTSYGGDYDYAAPAADYDTGGYSADYAPPPDYANGVYDNGYAYNDAQPCYDGCGDGAYATTYDNTAYDHTAYAPPPPPQPQYAPQYQPVPACACSQPTYSSGATAYGWRDQSGEWHVTSQDRRYSYSYSY